MPDLDYGIIDAQYKNWPGRNRIDINPTLTPSAVHRSDVAPSSSAAWGSAGKNQNTITDIH